MDNQKNPTAQLFYTLLIIVSFIAGIASFYFAGCFIWYGAEYMAYYGQYSYDQTAIAAIFLVLTGAVGAFSQMTRNYLVANYNIENAISIDKPNKKD